MLQQTVNVCILYAYVAMLLCCYVEYVHTACTSLQLTLWSSVKHKRQKTAPPEQKLIQS